MRFWLLWHTYRGLTALLALKLRIIHPLLKALAPAKMTALTPRLYPKKLERPASLWLHGASIGELKLLTALTRTWPIELQQGLLVTAATRNGFAYLKEHWPIVQSRLLPVDLPAYFRKLFGDEPIPNLVIVETELWPGLYRFVHRNGARLIIINGRLSSKTLKHRNNPLLRHSMTLVDRVLTRSVQDSDRFRLLGVPANKMKVTGNLKFDFEPGNVKEQILLRWLTQTGPLLIFASIANDEAVPCAAAALQLAKKIPNLRILWAPRQIQDRRLHLQALAAGTPILRSQLAQENPQILVLDTFGELSGCYRYARISIIGGSFNHRGGQNFLESLQAGAPAIMGPSTENFRVEVEEATQAGCIQTVENPQALYTAARTLFENEEQWAAMSSAAKAFIDRHRGAIARTNQELIDLGIVPCSANQER